MIESFLRENNCSRHEMEYWRLRTSNARKHSIAEQTLTPIPITYADPAALSDQFTSERQSWLQRKGKKEVQIHLEWAAHFSSNPLASLKSGKPMLSHLPPHTHEAQLSYSRWRFGDVTRFVAYFRSINPDYYVGSILAVQDHFCGQSR
jgi:hypothetical protein